METDEKLERLRRKIENRINSSYKKDDRFSAKELINILSEQISKYNLILVDKVEKDKNSLNRKIAKTRIINKKVPYIESITSIIHEDGTQELIVNFSCNNEFKGFARITKDLSVKFDFMKSEYSKSDILKVLRENIVNFIIYFNAMDSFCLEYPGFSYVWNGDSKDTYTQSINDGFISAKINLSDLSSTRATLYRTEDFELARMKSKKYGELYDYIDFYNDRMLVSLKVNEENLNPLYKEMVNHYRSENKNCSRRLRVK